jgi:hypothetical protein
MDNPRGIVKVKFTGEDSQINFGLWEAWSALETNLTLKIGMHFLP